MRIITIFLSLFPILTFGQMTWHEIPTPTGQNLNCIQFVDDQVGYIGGFQTLMKTEDGGANWTEVTIDSIVMNTSIDLDIFDMHWFDAQHGIMMAGVWGGMFETFDGGSNWTPLVPANSGFCQSTALYFFDENHGFAGGAGCFEGHIIDRFENGTWSTTMDPQDWNTDNWVSSIEFMNSDTGFAGTSGGTLLRTVDGGLNWDSITNPTAGHMITDFVFEGVGVIRATHQNNQWGVMISDDYGLTWDWDPETATFFYPQMNAAHIDNNGTTYLGGIEGNQGTIGVIFDNSAGWWNYGNVGAKVNDITSIIDSTTFLVCDSGKVFVNVDPSTLNTIEQEEDRGFDLWPNPFTDILNLERMNSGSEVLTISNLNGSIIGRHPIVSSRTALDLSGLAPGPYLISLDDGKNMKVVKAH